MIPPALLFGLGLLSADMWGQIFPKWPAPKKGMLMNITQSFASNALPPQQATVTPVFPGDPPRTAVRSDPGSYGASILPWDPVHMKASVCLLRMWSPFPPVLWCSCAQASLAFNVRCSSSSFSQSQIPRHGDLMWGSELSLLWVSLCGTVTSSLWASHLVCIGVLIPCNHPSYHLDEASSLSSRVGYLFESFQSIWLKVIQHLVVILLFL